MPFTIRLGKQNDPSTLQVLPPVDHFPVGTSTIGFHNASQQYAVAVSFPADLVASPNPLLLGPGQRGSVQIGTKAPGVYSCNTYITGPSCPTCGTKFTANSGRFLRTDSTPDPPDPPDPPGEPIIILD